MNEVVDLWILGDLTELIVEEDPCWIDLKIILESPKAKFTIIKKLERFIL